ncbi:hypothetical protein BDA99DRAFT_504575 [Phascolomyces articulosus]|uniref:Uncharacterized protein n=1 Tax=Phascolomyces articulosus TaxID=60185 RepID=A0AAD5PHC6_9FUNG|nr:hypothetical protein BDA99DRAFT_504575 [Phascolomyces articulosus]
MFLNTAIAIFRIALYTIFFWQSRKNHFIHYYYVWLPAIAAWIQDGLCLYYHFLTNESDAKILFDYGPIKYTLYLKAIFTLFAIWKYQRMIINPTNKQLQEEKEKIMETIMATRHLLFSFRRKCVYLSLALLWTTAVYYFDIRLQLRSAFAFFEILLMIRFCEYGGVLVGRIGILFAPLPSISSTSSVIGDIYLCLTTLMPINTLFQAIIMLLHGMFFSISWMGLPISAFAFYVFLLENLVTSKYIIFLSIIYVLREDEDGPRSVKMLKLFIKK